MALQDIFGSAVQAYDQRRQLEGDRAFQAQQRESQLAAFARQEREARLKALRAQGEAFLNAGMVDQAAQLVPQVAQIQSKASGVNLEPPTFLGEPMGAGQPNNLNNPRTDAAVRAWLGVEPQKPMAVAFGTSLVDPRTGRALYDGSTQRLAVEQGKNETRMEVATANNASREVIAAQRVASAEDLLGRRLTAQERQIVLRGNLASQLETQRQGGRLAVADANNAARAERAKAKPTNARRATVQGHLYTLGADGKPAAHLGPAKEFDAGAFTRTWLAQQGVMPGMGVPADRQEAYQQALAAARSRHLRDPLNLPRTPAAAPAAAAPGAAPGGRQATSLADILRVLQAMPDPP